jgi:hypothetical protein
LKVEQGFPEKLTQATKLEAMVLYKIKPIFDVITQMLEVST